MTERQDCTDIPAVISGQNDLTSVHSCAGSFYHDVYDSLSNKTAKVLTSKSDGPDAGTGFFVQDGTHMVTSAHVVNGSPEIQIHYQNKEYTAKLERLDDKNDLAELKIVGIEADPSRAVKVKDKISLTSGDPVVSVGIPGLHNETKYLNPGTLAKVGPLYDILKSPVAPSYNDARKIENAFNSGNPGLKADAQAVADSPRLILIQGARPGQSGSPTVDADENLVSVVTAVNGNNTTVDVPYTKVVDLLKSPERTFNFNYEQQNKLVMPSMTDLAFNGAGVAAAAAGLLGKGRFAPVAFGAARAVSLASEISDFAHTTSAENKSDLGVKIAEDAGAVGGGLAATMMWKSPLGRIAGVGVMGASIASRFYTDSQEKHYILHSLTRKDGDSRPPWSF